MNARNIVIALLIAGGGFLAYTKIIKPRMDKGTDDPNKSLNGMPNKGANNTTPASAPAYVGGFSKGGGFADNIKSVQKSVNDFRSTVDGFVGLFNRPTSTADNTVSSSVPVFNSSYTDPGSFNGLGDNNFGDPYVGENGSFQAADYSMPTDSGPTDFGFGLGDDGGDTFA